MSGATLREIAKKSGFSYQTVSRVLNKQGHLHRTETVRRVMEVAEELGYRPNLNARGIQMGRTRTIGILADLAPDSFSRNLLLGIHDEVISEDYLPIFLMSRPGLANELEQIHRLVDRRVDGVVLRPVMHEVSDQYLREVVDRHLHLVTVDIQVPDTRFVDFVGTDDLLGGLLAARHLLELGHRRLAFVSWFMHLIMKQHRRDAFCDAVRSVPGATAEVVDIQFDRETWGKAEALELLRRPDRPTAVFVGADDIARGIYLAAAELGLRIPQDLSVVGYSDLDFAMRMRPPLTTVRQDPYQIGRLASRLVLQRIRGKITCEEPQQTRLRPELVVRASTGPAPRTTGNKGNATARKAAPAG